MAQPSKPTVQRKLDSVEDTAADNRNIPTSETQKLYDDYRRIEEGLTLGDQLELQDGQDGNGGHAAYLQPPTHSQAPTSPRSPASTTHSLTRVFDDTGLEEEDHPNKKRSRARRNGPLAERKRAKAALMRKIGACAACKSRRVGCNHFDNTIFEQEYQRRKQRELGTPLSPRSREGPPSTSQPSFNGPTADLIGSWQPQSLPERVLSSGNQRDATEAEIDDLIRENPSASPVTTAPYYFATNGPTPPLTDVLPAYSPAPRSMPFNALLMSTPLFPPASQQVPIGRQRPDQWFECRHGDDDISNPVGVSAGVCNLLFGTLPELLQHYQSMHGPYFDQLRMWKCIAERRGEGGISRVCGVLNNIETGSCIQCYGYQFERWYYALVIRTPSLTSGPSVCVSSRDGSMGGFGVPQQQYSWSGAQGQGNLEMLFPGRYLGTNQGGGSYQSFERKMSMAQSSGKRPSVRIHPDDCRSEKYSKQLLSQYTITRPFLLILSTLFLIAIENWLVTGLGNKQIALAVLDTARNHVFSMSFLCVFVGVAGMWMYRHIRFRLDEGLGSSRHNQCPFVGLSGVVEHRDLEDAGSMRGEDNLLAVDVPRQSGTLVMR